jgi:hypothetical protein
MIDREHWANRAMTMALKEDLMTAANLLSGVYHYACENGMQELESQMSVADSCIHEALDYIELIEKE